MKHAFFYKRMVFFILVILGIIFRVWIASLFPHQPLFDETDYIGFSKGILNNFWYADCCAKTYGYPLFLSVIFSLFGPDSLHVVVISQVILDILTAGILFVISRRIFSNPRVSYLTFFIYLFNPLTPSYTGLFLSEVLAMFLMSVVIYIFVLKKSMAWQFILGMFIGWLTFTRVMLWWWAVVFLITSFLWKLLVEKKKFSVHLFLTLIGFIIILIYPTLANWRFYKVVSPIPPVPFVYLDFLHSLKITRWPGLFNEDFFREVPIEVSSEHPKIFGEDRDIFMQKVQPRLDIAIETIKDNPLPFIASRVRNVFLFWDKSHLFFYTDPFYPEDTLLVRLCNIVFLFLSGMGIVSVWVKQKKTFEEKRLLYFVLLLLLYFTFPLSLLTPEERITLPVYPVLVLFMPLGIYFLFCKVINKTDR